MAARELLQADADRRHPRGVQLQHREPSRFIREPEEDRPREPAAAQERRVELVGPVRRPDDEHAALAGEAVDLREELVDVAVVDAERFPRRPAIASISSMKTIEGRFSRARSKSRRMFRSESPTHLLITSAPEIG